MYMFINDRVGQFGHLCFGIIPLLSLYQFSIQYFCFLKKPFIFLCNYSISNHYLISFEIDKLATWYVRLAISHVLVVQPLKYSYSWKENLS